MDPTIHAFFSHSLASHLFRNIPILVLFNAFHPPARPSCPLFPFTTQRPSKRCIDTWRVRLDAASLGRAASNLRKVLDMSQCGQEGLAGAPRSGYVMVEVSQALEEVLSRTSTKPAERVSLQEVQVGDRVASDVVAESPHPDFDASIKDGYAVVSEDDAGKRRIVGEVRCGHVVRVEEGQEDAGFVLGRGEVAYVTTGAPVPPGADAVVEVESTVDQGDGYVYIARKVDKGNDIRKRGSDVQVGETVLSAGDAVGAAELALLATLGVGHVDVHEKPVVAILSTGDELVEPNTNPLPRGKVRDCNRAMLKALAQSAGAKVVDLGIAGDHSQALDELMDAAAGAGADAVITSGGVSMGDRDLVKPMLQKRGNIHFGRLNMKPGKPCTFATVDLPATPGSISKQMLCFGLPGNPVSSWATFHLFVLPMLRKMAGWFNPHLRRVHVKLAHSVKTDPVRPEYQRSVLEWMPPSDDMPCGGFLARGTGGQSSSRISSARSANALLELPAAKGYIPEGSIVSALLVDDLGSMPETKHRPMTSSSVVCQ